MSEQSQDAASTAEAPMVRLSRRELLLSTLVGVTFLTPLAAAIFAAVRYMIPPARGISGVAEHVQVATTDEIADGASKDFIYNDAPYAVVRLGSDFRAFSKVCTHLGCIVEWRAKDRIFFCPCHNGVFDARGNVVSGPPPQALARLKVEVASGKVYVGG